MQNTNKTCSSIVSSFNKIQTNINQSAQKLKIQSLLTYCLCSLIKKQL